MKKYSLIIIILISMLFTGCTIEEKESNNLSCEKNNISSDIKYKEIQEFNFNGNEINEYKLILRFDFSNFANDQKVFEEITNKLRLEYSKAIEKGVQTDVYPEGNNIIAMFTINPKLFDGILDYNNYDLKKALNSKISPKALKSKMENQNYSCNFK